MSDAVSANPLLNMLLTPGTSEKVLKILRWRVFIDALTRQSRVCPPLCLAGIPPRCHWVFEHSRLDLLSPCGRIVFQRQLVCQPRRCLLTYRFVKELRSINELQPDDPNKKQK